MNSRHFTLVLKKICIVFSEYSWEKLGLKANQLGSVEVVLTKLTPKMNLGLQNFLHTLI